MPFAHPVPSPTVPLSELPAPSAPNTEHSDAAEETAGVDVADLARVFGDGTGLHPTDLRIRAGEFVSILGPSGCGKSTLLRCLAGLERPQSGVIRFGGNVVFDAARRIDLTPRRRRIGMVFQDLALWPHLTAFENIAFPLRVSGRRQVREAVDSALDLVGLTASARKLPHQLSGGQQQRVAVARAVVARPDLLLMDEPLSALDAALKVQLRAELRALTRELGLTTVYVTHDQEEAMSLSTRIVVLAQGHVRQVSVPEELYRAPADEFVAEFVGVFNRLPSASGIHGVRPGSVRIAAPDAPAPPGGLAVPGRVADCEYRGGSYALRVDVADAPAPWSVLSDHPRGRGEEIALHVDHSDIIVVREAADAP